MEDRVGPLFRGSIEKLGLVNLAYTLGVNTGTIKRWILKKEVPNEYIIDFYRILGLDINPEDFSFKEKDQFFTPINTAGKCLHSLFSKLLELGIDEKEYTFIEPSAGSGARKLTISSKKLETTSTKKGHTMRLTEEMTETTEGTKRIKTFVNKHLGRVA